MATTSAWHTGSDHESGALATPGSFAKASSVGSLRRLSAPAVEGGGERDSLGLGRGDRHSGARDKWSLVRENDEKRKRLSSLIDSMDLCCVLDRGAGLPIADTFGTIDPYITMTIVEGDPRKRSVLSQHPTGGRGFEDPRAGYVKSSVVNQNQEPRWNNEKLTMKLPQMTVYAKPEATTGMGGRTADDPGGVGMGGDASKDVRKDGISSGRGEVLDWGRCLGAYENLYIHVKVWDWDFMKSDDMIGEIVFPPQVRAE